MSRIVENVVSRNVDEYFKNTQIRIHP